MNHFEHRLSWALQRCRELGLRLTASRQAILRLLASQRLPVTLERIAAADPLRGAYDQATLYRSLTLLREAEVVRSVGTPHKAAYYLLNVPGEHCHFLICRRCGAVKPSPCTHQLANLEEELSRTEGYSDIYHELTFYGICPDCQRRPADPSPVKLQVRV